MIKSLIYHFDTTIVTRKYDTLIHSPGYGGKEVRLTGLADYSSKQELVMEREAVSLQPSPLVQADMGMRKPHSL